VPGCITDRTGWRAIAVSVASRIFPAVGIFALSACSPVRPPSPEKESVEISSVAPARVPSRAVASEERASISPAERGPAQPDPGQIQPGDIIFHTSRSAQSEAIQLATQSPYSHVGIVESGSAGLVVLEAVQPVKRTPVDEWIARGLDGHFVVKRLTNASELLTPDAALRLRTAGARFVGKRYDTAFGWSDDRIYCSELIYKVYHEALGVEVGPIQRLREFDLSSPAVRAKLTQRYGQNIPLDEPVVSPGGIFDSPTLTTVLER